MAPSDLVPTLVAQTVKRLPAMQETRIWSLGQEDPLEKAIATHSSTLAWKIPWMEEPGRLQTMGSQRVRHDWSTSFHFTCCIDECLLCVFMWWNRPGHSRSLFHKGTNPKVRAPSTWPSDPPLPKASPPATFTLAPGFNIWILVRTQTLSLEYHLW